MPDSFVDTNTNTLNQIFKNYQSSHRKAMERQKNAAERVFAQKQLETKKKSRKRARSTNIPRANKK